MALQCSYSASFPNRYMLKSQLLNFLSSSLLMACSFQLSREIQRFLVSACPKSDHCGEWSSEWRSLFSFSPSLTQINESRIKGEKKKRKGKISHLLEYSPDPERAKAEPGKTRGLKVNLALLKIDRDNWTELSKLYVCLKLGRKQSSWNPNQALGYGHHKWIGYGHYKWDLITVPHTHPTWILIFNSIFHEFFCLNPEFLPL